MTSPTYSLPITESIVTLVSCSKNDTPNGVLFFFSLTNPFRSFRENLTLWSSVKHGWCQFMVHFTMSSNRGLKIRACVAMPIHPEMRLKIHHFRDVVEISCQSCREATPSSLDWRSKSPNHQTGRSLICSSSLYLL